jgi:hypothetical protein
MKTIFYILLTVIILTSCVQKTTNKQQTDDDTKTAFKDNAEEKDEPKQLNKTNKQTLTDSYTEEETDYVFIGGKRYKGGWEIERVYLWIDPEDPKSSNSLENIELHWNLKELTIEGKNLDKVDFSPISLLTKLEILIIEGNITRMPDMSNLKQLHKVEVKKAALKSLEGINGPSIEWLEIESPKSNNNNMLKVNDLKNMNVLKVFSFSYGKIDVSGIDRFTSLEFIELLYCEPYNINCIGNIKNLKALQINLTSTNPSIEFLKDMPNLYLANFYGNYQKYNYSAFNNKPSQVLDVTPLAASKELQDIEFLNLIIKNISALDVLDLPKYRYIALYGSKLYDETEKSRHSLHFERGGDR